MYILKTDREKRLQKLLIPVNIVICLLALTAILSLLIAPILKVNVGKILRDEKMIEFVEEKIDSALGDDLSNTEQGEVNYKPVVTMLVTNILGKAEGSVEISGISGFRVLVAGSDKKADKVLDELLFGKNALATNLINSVVDGVAGMFSTHEGREVLEQALVSTLINQIIDSVEDKEVIDAFNKNIRELTDIFKELGDPSKSAEDSGADVAKRFIDKLDEHLGGQISDGNKQSFVDHITDLYAETQSNLDEDASVSFEAIICVTISKNLDLSQVNLGDMFDGLFSKSDDSQSSVHRGAIDEELPDSETDSEGEGEESANKIVTNYDDLLLEMGYDQEAKDNLKEKMRTTLNDELSNLIKEQGISDYLEYYQYVFFLMLLFIFPWFLLFLIAFIRLFVKNKRCMAWYVKVFCWIPSLIWLVLTLIPVVAPKISFLSSFWNGDNSAIVRSVIGGISSFTWINGLCYILIWLVTVFWQFPIKLKIRKERKRPEVEDADDDDEITF